MKNDLFLMKKSKTNQQIGPELINTTIYNLKLGYVWNDVQLLNT